MRKLGHREVKPFIHGHTDTQDLKPVNALKDDNILVLILLHSYLDNKFCLNQNLQCFKTKPQELLRGKQKHLFCPVP